MMRSIDQSLPYTNPYSKFAVPLTLQAGEGISGFAFRAAASNGFVMPQMMLSILGCEKRKVANLAGSLNEIPNDFNRLLAMDGAIAGLDGLLHTSIHTPPGWVQFHGRTIRKMHLHPGARRVSPTSLSKANYLKEVWSVQRIAFDPATKEVLLDTCPACNRKLGFTRSVGVHICDRCCKPDEGGCYVGVDLRDFPQPIIDVDDVEAMDFVTSLVNPEACPDEARNRAGGALKGIQPGHLFEFIVHLSPYFTPLSLGQTDVSPYRPRRKTQGPVPAEALAAAGRVILDWPNSFDRVVERARADRDRRSKPFGIQKELGYLAAMPQFLSFEPNIASEVRLRLNRFYVDSALTTDVVRKKGQRHRTDVVTMAQASDEFGIDRRKLAKEIGRASVNATWASHPKSPVLIDRKSLERRLEIEASEITLQRAAVHFNIHHLELMAFARSQWGSNCVKYSEKVPVAKVNETMELLRRNARATAPDRALALATAVNKWRRPASGIWSSLLPKILSGRLSVGVSAKGIGLDALLVADESTVKLIGSERRCLELAGDQALSVSELGFFLKTCWLTAREITASGLLDSPVTVASAQHFNDAYALTGEIVVELKEAGYRVRNRDLTSFFSDRGVRPLMRLPRGGRLIWRRRSVAELLPQLSLRH